MAMQLARPHRRFRAIALTAIVWLQWPGQALPAAQAGGDASDVARTLEAVARPIHDVGFADVVTALTGHRVIPADPERDAAVLDRIRRALAAADGKARAAGIRSKRPNEAGNRMEQFVKDALGAEGFRADVPRSTTGRRQAAGYPDLELIDQDGRVIYLEVKTYQRHTLSSSQRAFYFSPTAHAKVLCDATHLLVGFEFESQPSNESRIYRPVGWKLVDLSKLRVRLKYEFNASNRQIYNRGSVLLDSAAGARPRAGVTKRTK